MCKEQVKYVWSEECQQSFDLSKKLLTENDVLTYYNPLPPIYVAYDASSYGVGAVLSHEINGEERTSSTLSLAEQKYSNIEREALAIIHKYLFGRKFVLLSDHQPLQFIFGKGCTRNCSISYNTLGINVIGI